MHFNPKKAFRQAAAVLVLTLAGAGAGGFAYQHTHNSPDAAKTPAETAAFKDYAVRLNAIQTAQGNLDSTTDEDAANHLRRQKIQFRTDVVLDTALDNEDVSQLGARFNALSANDKLTFRAVAENPGSAFERGSCLNDVVLTKNRAETAERVEDCMLVYAQRDRQNTKTAGEIGGLFGFALAGSFLLGRRRAKPAL